MRSRYDRTGGMYAALLRSHATVSIMSAPSDHCCNLDDPAHPLVEGAARKCHRCGYLLCLRQQVINLALSNTDEMFCLNCLSKENEQTPEAVLKGIMSYIQQRDCFRKEWIRYSDVDFCPDRKGCLPSVCFPHKNAP